ncbi:MAG: T9SS type A sorting domain-containing protein [Chitinophagales bacterium]|nr:T9SS type A sorting domain-containing protein [Bacteroidota bacterium]
MKKICYLLCLLAGLQNLSAQLLLNGTFEEIEQNTLCENPTPYDPQEKPTHWRANSSCSAFFSVEPPNEFFPTQHVKLFSMINDTVRGRLGNLYQNFQPTTFSYTLSFDYFIEHIDFFWYQIPRAKVEIFQWKPGAGNNKFELLTFWQNNEASTEVQHVDFSFSLPNLNEVQIKINGEGLYNYIDQSLNLDVVVRYDNVSLAEDWTGIADSDVSFSSFLHPNPSAGSLYVSPLLAENKDYVLSFYNVQGAKVWEATPKEKIDLAHLPNGIYLAVLRDAKQQIIHTEIIVLSR